MNTINDIIKSVKRFFTQAECDFIRNNFTQLGAKKCAISLGRSHFYIEKKAAALGVTRRTGKQWRIDKSPCKVNMTLFETIRMPAVAYFLGFLWADGHVTKKKNTIQIHVHQDDGIELQKIFIPIVPFGVLNYTKKSQYVFYLSDLRLHDFLVEHDYLVKSLATPTKILNQIPTNLRCYFWRGYFDGDGCFTKKSNICVSFTGSFNQNWTDTQIMIWNITNEVPKIARRQGQKGASSFVYVYGRKKVRALLDFLYAGDTFGLSRKRKLYEDWLLTNP